MQTGAETAAQEVLELQEPFALKAQVAARLAAHRSRRGHAAPTLDQPAATPRERTSRIAAAVAERYAKSKSYRSFLAEEAERAIRQAEVAAEVARLNAQAVAAAQYDLLEKLDEYAAESSAPMPLPSPEAAALADTVSARASFQPEDSFEPQLDLKPAAPLFNPASLTVRMPENLRRPDAELLEQTRRNDAREVINAVTQIADPEEVFSLDEEIAFRQAPVFEPIEPPVDIPANLIEFPRQLVAPRRARPRLAEGPLREEGAEPPSHQLRIFEVETDQISSEPAVEAEAPEWSSILLGAQPRSDSATVDGAVHASYASYEYSAHLPVEYATAGDRPAQHLEPTYETRHLYSAPFQVAPMSLRLMSAIVDTVIICASFLIFMAVSVLTISHFTPGGLQMTVKELAIPSAAALLALGLGYQLLFFTLSDATPGMRYARIGLCTFADDNPKRDAMRRRILATLLATAPLGLGLLWAFFDEDRLGWHDRISRMYQRSY